MWSLEATPYKFIGFGDIHGPKPYKFIGFGDIDGPKPYGFIGFGDTDGPKPYKFRGFGDIDATPEDNGGAQKTTSEAPLLGTAYTWVFNT